MPSDGVRSLVLAFGTAGLCVALTGVVPGLAPYRPWSPGDPLPLLSVLLPNPDKVVREDAISGLSVEVAPPPVDVPPADAPPEALDHRSETVLAPGDVADAAPTGADGAVPPATQPAANDETLAAALGGMPSAAGLPTRAPGVATPLIDADHRGMDAFYRALHRAAAGAGLARASHYGDSTIAADGITSTVRARLQARFGNGGPGYLSAGMDPRWSFRRDVTIRREGTWNTVSLLLGGGSGRYGYGGIVSTADPDATLSVTSPKGGDKKPTPMHRFELWLQGGPERGSWFATLDGAGAGAGSARADNTVDLRHVVDDPDGYTRVTLGARGGPVPFYGLVLETKGPGVVWDALGVVGVGSRSFTQHGKRHIASQIAQRDPDLLVLMLGGNELGLPALGVGDGSGYVPHFTDTLRRLRAGAPDAACLIVTPVDQGTRVGGGVRTKPNLLRLVAAQRKAAAAEGCAFWNAWAAMGGPDAMARWSTMKPPLAWTDLAHLSTAGQDIIGNLLADAILHGYDAWLAVGGPARPAVATGGATVAGVAAAPLGELPPAPDAAPGDAQGSEPAPSPDGAAPAPAPQATASPAASPATAPPSATSPATAPPTPEAP